MVNTPIPQNLKSETKKAAKILRDFTMPNSKTGPDKLIPAGILAKAKGLAIITVFKAGFLVTARGGSGIVIAKLDDDNIDYSTGWSAPSAIGLAGLGGGFEIGVEVTDFVIILNSRAAINAFSKGGNLTLGGNFTVAAGPLGRNIEGDVSVRSPAAIYTYSKTKGIFAGISIEGSALIERKDANRKFYGRELRATQILCGEVDPPEECDALYARTPEHGGRGGAPDGQETGTQARGAREGRG
ncbi:hypothetical protein EGW08_018675 [Elysia chlorotica]|uniref:Ysc84 actin-binding domain-containing protein n=1 Tax=Elysia chlorotica TaxID=188477 RepID=A0A433SWB7_ELYCH|nr:hypothetical protein EGW08_018675 [Elysia chlorotica]